ncbi:LOW QUALITY PROTEIN: ankyrin repeat, SAM and basic leucine zipper domain-containing protein 1-like [Carassius carassius]|uniref:LOW QUALITY PROTEIN: ankyrin repeat, SAM and basic leucine zipper domain-containing protein 1-like n=1 Tax=Carassius carassius TaxID=217509 RepID=UPI002868FAF7|nr:LOW QUALITY PROTEIN: ankyrin repeat, SAM and basic leucine zipper domain-containing protein 1-like [Carassius carassius]
MDACTAASATEEMISRCVALLLSRNADPNVCNRSSMSCLMLAARDGYCQVINLLVSHGAELNFQNDNELTALIIAVQYGRKAAMLKLLQLGADKFIKTKTGKTAADIAKISSKLNDIELLLYGLNLDHLSDIMVENDVTWSDLLIMEKRDLEKIGVTNPEDQKKILSSMEQMHLDKVDLDTLTPLYNIDSGREDFFNFLISLKQQCCYLTETLQDVISRFPRSPSEVVLTCDPKKEAQALCTELVTQTGDLQKEILCLKSLLTKVDHTEYNFKLLQPVSNNVQGGKPHKRFAAVLGLGLLLAGLLFVLSQ